MVGSIGAVRTTTSDTSEIVGTRVRGSTGPASFGGEDDGESDGDESFPTTKLSGSVFDGVTVFESDCPSSPQLSLLFTEERTLDPVSFAEVEGVLILCLPAVVGEEETRLCL